MRRGPARWLAETLIGWAHRLLSQTREAWGEAMRNELPHIADDREALEWALGCFAAAWQERIRALKLLNSIWARSALVLLLGFKVFDDVFATLLTLAYRSRAAGAAELLGSQTPGDDYLRLVPLMNAVPAWLHGLWVLAAGLYVAAIASIVLRKGQAYLFVIVAFATEMLAQTLGRPILAASGVVVNPNPSILASVVIPIVLPLGLALALWVGNRDLGRDVPQN